MACQQHGSADQTVTEAQSREDDDRQFELVSLGSSKPVKSVTSVYVVSRAAKTSD